MAFIEMTYYSTALQRTVPVRVASPGDKYIDLSYYNKPGKKFKMLLLMHGYFGSFVDWTNATRIQKWAETNNFLVVMPSGGNSFYVDLDIYPNDYGKMIGEELPQVMRTIFPVSEKREDMYIAGLSMGGFGAIRNGLKYSDTFSHVISFSGGFDQFEFPFEEQTEHTIRVTSPLGDLREAIKTDKNPRVCAEALMERHKADPSVPLPKIYMSCGTEDPLIKGNYSLRDYLRGLGFDVTWFEGPGEHAWTFWDPQMQKVIAEFLPLEDAVEGLDSGNVIFEEDGVKI